MQSWSERKGWGFNDLFETLHRTPKEREESGGWVKGGRGGVTGDKRETREVSHPLINQGRKTPCYFGPTNRPGKGGECLDPGPPFLVHRTRHTRSGHVRDPLSRPPSL